ncbi:hypothetical protein FHR99_000876 [Litorivivens lipolytica]|uniref:Uncharacterized protein n=1 Tax=Litorivivens lipolytica TaxID=1524264 RepID=A0A7W4Z671_9GAMM|nr:hypothetical protein [Litorivivens lipolytica]MBB3046640.1 hypothetical protein [Litorivivens lipolytica]
MRLALSRYRVPPSVLALIANLSPLEMEQALNQRRLTGTTLHWYQRMRHYEHTLGQTIDDNLRRFGKFVLPRYLSDRHMAMYAPDSWAILPSARIASGVSKWVCSQLDGADRCRIKTYDFNQLHYDHWLEENQLDHGADVLDFWSADKSS